MYVVDTSGRVLALARATGKTRWMTQLPDSKTWSGPVLAGNVLWFASSQGEIVGVDAATGKVGNKVSVGAAVYIPPIVAQGRMFVFDRHCETIALN